MKIQRRTIAFICVGVIICVLFFFIRDIIKNFQNNSWKAENVSNKKTIADVKKLQDTIDFVQTHYPGIVVWGDSLTERGVASELDCSVQKDIIEPMNNQLREANLDGEFQLAVPVINMGVGSESSAMIAARSGAIPYILLRELVIPSDTSEVPVFIGLQDGSTPQIKFGRSGSGVEKVEIAGVEGIITTDYNRNYVFRRTKEGKETIVDEGEPILSEGSQLYRSYIPVIYIGTNGGYNEDPKVLIEQQQAMINYNDALEDKCIIVGIHTGNAEERESLEQVMTETWGENYINLRQELVNIDYNKYGIKLSDDDMESLSTGACPDVLLESDGLHFNSKGNRIVAELICQRMIKLGVFENLQKTIDNFIADAEEH